MRIQNCPVALTIQNPSQARPSHQSFHTPRPTQKGQLGAEWLEKGTPRKSSKCEHARPSHLENSTHSIQFACRRHSASANQSRPITLPGSAAWWEAGCDRFPAQVNKSPRTRESQDRPDRNGVHIHFKGADAKVPSATQKKNPSLSRFQLRDDSLTRPRDRLRQTVKAASALPKSRRLLEQQSIGNFRLPKRRESPAWIPRTHHRHRMGSKAANRRSTTPPTVAIMVLVKRSVARSSFPSPVMPRSVQILTARPALRRGVCAFRTVYGNMGKCSPGPHGTVQGHPHSLLAADHPPPRGRYP